MIDVIINLNKESEEYNQTFLDFTKLKLYPFQQQVLNTNINSYSERNIQFDLPNRRQAGRTFTMLIKAIEMCKRSKTSICIVSNLRNNIKYCFQEILDILNAYIKKEISFSISTYKVLFENGSSIEFLSSNSIRGRKFDYIMREHNSFFSELQNTFDDSHVLIKKSLQFNC